MTAWTTLLDAILAQDKPWTQAIARALRDNPQAIAEGASGSPSIVGLNPDVVAVASNSATLTFTNLPAKDLIEFELIGLKPVTTGAVLRAQVSTNGGSTWTTSGYFFAKTITEIPPSSGAASSAEGGYSDSKIDISRAGGVNNGSGNMLSGVFQAFCFMSTSFLKSFTWHTYHTNDANSAPSVVNGGGTSNIAAGTQINAIKFFYSTGNISNGQITMRARRATVAN